MGLLTRALKRTNVLSKYANEVHYKHIVKYV